MIGCDFDFRVFIKLKGERSMEFWIIMIVFVAMGGTCSLAGTWWDRKKKKEDRKQ